MKGTDNVLYTIQQEGETASMIFSFKQWIINHHRCKNMCSLQKLCFTYMTEIQGGPKKPDRFLKYVTPVYDEVGRQFVYQNVELFIGSKPNIQNVAIIKYSSHKFGETILRRIEKQHEV